MKNGIAASKGYAIGKVFIQQHEEIVITDEKVTDVAAAKEELNKAELGIIKELYELYGGRMMVVASREASTYEKYSLYYMKELMKTWVMKGYSAEDVENGKR